MTSSARSADLRSAVSQVCDLPATGCGAMLSSCVRHAHVPKVSVVSSQRDEKQLAEGSSFLATLGYGVESLQDSKSQHRVDSVFGEQIEARARDGGAGTLRCRRAMRLARYSKHLKARAQ